MALNLNVGDWARITGTFTVGGTKTDPTDATITVKKPDGSTEQKTKLGGTLVNDEVGVWHGDFEVDQEGWWDFEIVSTGVAAASDSGGFNVLKDRI